MMIFSFIIELIDRKRDVQVSNPILQNPCASVSHKLGKKE